MGGDGSEGRPEAAVADLVGAVRIDQLGADRGDIRMCVQKPDHAFQGIVVLKEGIRVQQQDTPAIRMAEAEVVAGAEAEIVGAFDQRDVGVALANRIGGAVAGGVVDDDDL